jgi:hypothetical protein
MNIKKQIEQAEIVLDILKGRRTNNEPKWEFYSNGKWIDPLPTTNPLIAAQTFHIRLKPEADAFVVPEGFTPWNGGKSPVEAGVFVEVMLRNGKRCVDDFFWWEHTRGDEDVVAYRIIPAEPAQEQPQSCIKLGDMLRDNVTKMEFLITGSTSMSVQISNTWFPRNKLHELFDVSHDRGLTWTPVSNHNPF